MKAYSETLQGRINAMSRTQNVLTSAPGASVNLYALLQEELQAQNGEIGGQVTLEGPTVALSGKPAETLTLALHELATNAAKYGGLSSPRGSVTVSWTIDDAKEKDPGQLVIRWSETGVKVIPPKKRGSAPSWWKISFLTN